jgi:hypothetical protein
MPPDEPEGSDSREAKDRGDRVRPGRLGPTPRPGRRYSIAVGIAFLGLIAYAGLNTITTNEGGILGAGGDRGEALAQFAVPEARGSLVGDANVAQDDCSSSEIPCPADQRRTPACEVRGRQVIRVCDLFDRPLVISFWFTRGGDCLPTQDVVDRVGRRFSGRVNFLSVNVRDDRDTVRDIIRERGWEIPVGEDADGAVSNIYRVGVCPTVAYAYPGGILMGAKVGADELDEASLVADVRHLLRSSRRRAQSDR